MEMQGWVVSRGILHEAEQSRGPEWVGRRVTHPSIEAVGKGRELEGRAYRSGYPQFHSAEAYPELVLEKGGVTFQSSR